MPLPLLAIPALAGAAKYVRYLPYVVIFGLVLAVGWFKWDADVNAAERDKALVEKRIAEEKNVTLLATIADLQEWRVLTSKLYGELTASITALTAEIGTTQTELDEAGNDAEVKKWYDTPVPEPVRRVHNKGANRK